uniref:ABC-three component system protein n=1 Tax=Psychromonas sp. Urea-02u-13 TaxID=2058326 RepID=UPI000C3381C9
MAHDASATWSGFNYQGKVGLFYALRLMNDDLSANAASTFDLHELIFENHEDFDIKKDNVLESIHQVKAYNSGGLARYKNAVLTTVLELHTKQLLHTQGFLHTWKKIVFSGDNTIENFILNEVLALKEEWDNCETQEDSKIAKAVNASLLSGKIPKISAILRLCYAGFNGAQIAADLGVFISNAQAQPISNFSIYKYRSGDDFCDLENVNLLVLHEISNYLNHKGLPNSEDIRTRIFSSLLGNVDEHIINRHEHLNQNTGPIPIIFPEIIEKLESDVIADASPALFAFEFKKMFTDCVYNFINDPDLCGDVEYEKYFSDSETSEFEYCLKYLLTLPASQLLDYYIQQSPQSKIAYKECMVANAFDIEKDGIT